MNFIINLLIFLISLSILVFVHELGHFIFAKMFKVYCHEFSIGMGPAIFKKKFKFDKETYYAIRALPIGGFVSMAGESIEENQEFVIEDKRTLTGIKAWKRAIITIAGVVFNFIFAIILFLIISLFSKAQYKEAYLKVNENSQASSVGLMDMDEVINLTITYPLDNACVAGCKISSSEQLMNILSETSFKNEDIKQEITMVVLRGEEEKTFHLEREYKEETLTILGISINTYKPKFFTRIGLGFEQFGNVIKLMFKSIGTLFTKEGISQVGGPIQIYKISAEQASKGFLNYVYFIALLSINLGFINLFPIPGLDGARFIISIVESISGKKLNNKVEKYLNFIGLIFLMALMVVISIKDIIGLF